MTRFRQLAFGVTLLVAITGLLFAQHQRIQLAQTAADRAADRAAQAELASAQRRITINELNASLAEERAAQTQLRSQQARIQQQLAERQQTIKELTHENQQLRAWAGIRLPDVARRLRTRPAITGAADYQAWLSSSGAMHAAGDQSAGKRRPAE